MNIAGIGILFTRGRGIDAFDAALREGWQSPSPVNLPNVPDKPFFIYSVKAEDLTERIISRKIRRADRFTKMATLAAVDAVQDSGINPTDTKSNLGIILSTAFGPQVTTFRFQDDIIDYGEASVSPTLFSHSVHNAAASYIASVLDCRGPTLTVTQLAFSFHHALVLAQTWLQEGRCSYVLVGGVDECGTVMEYICSRKLRIAEDGKIKPFHFSDTPVAVPGEGSVFFLVTQGKCPKTYCELSGISLSNDSIDNDNFDMFILDADGMTGDETAYQSSMKGTSCIAGYAPLFGSMMTGSSFHCAAAAFMLKKQIRYACPVQDNPHSAIVCRITEQAKIESIQCIRYNCNNEKASITLRQSLY